MDSEPPAVVCAKTDKRSNLIPRTGQSVKQTPEFKKNDGQPTVGGGFYPSHPFSPTNNYLTP
ncbi:MAG: hypothetical protein JW984_05850 [Deltaproteobacteria bacterium]|uniref:Uncharacterized protein n=1 Tax=Candidatus Zymogenus saltonus TaxID=2844893 RepID=A0A9D8KCW5_9DELT|nr:hypothetical protein [Candidatus Zymogenus saltonus]